MTETAAIILAAGLSRRMGRKNKLLLPIQGVPMIRHVAQQYCEAVAGPIVIVTGHDSQQVQAALEGVCVYCVVNPNYEQGQQNSVAFGLKNCPIADLTLIGLGDQPLLNAQNISELISAHQTIAEDKISIPMRGDVRGNPIAVPRALRPRLTADPSRPGCMRFTRENPDLVHRHPLQPSGFYSDMDTPEAYKRFLKGGVQTS